MKHNQNYFVADVETGGYVETLNPILEIAIIVINQDLKEIDRYTSYIKPYRNLVIEEAALKYNGLSLDVIHNQGQDVNVVAKKVIAMAEMYKEGRYNRPIWVGHNFANFDKRFLRYLVESVGGKKHDDLFDGDIFDTMAHSRRKYGHIDVDNHKLEGCCEREGIKLIDAHSAIQDTEVTAQLFCAYIEQMRNSGGMAAAPQKSDYTRKVQFPL